MDSVKGAPSHLSFIRPAGRGVMLAKTGIEQAALPAGFTSRSFSDQFALFRIPLSEEGIALANCTSADTGAETTSWLGSVFTCGSEALLSLEGSVAALGTSLWEALHEHPYIGVVIEGGLGFGAALLLGGVTELAVTALTAYAGYRILAYGESLTEAFAKSILLSGGSSEQTKKGSSKQRRGRANKEGVRSCIDTFHAGERAPPPGGSHAR